MKKCENCKKKKALSEFDVLRTTHTHHVNCKKCVKEICMRTDKKYLYSRFFYATIRG